MKRLITVSLVLVLSLLLAACPGNDVAQPTVAAPSTPQADTTPDNGDEQAADDEGPADEEAPDDTEAEESADDEVADGEEAEDATETEATPAPTVEETADEEAVEDTEEEAAEGETVEISVDMNDIYFGDENNNVEDPPIWTAPAGAEVELTLVNNGMLQHNWAMVQLGEEIEAPYTDEQADKLLWEADEVPGGNTQTFTFTAPDEPGEYLVLCTVPGHYPSMQGRLQVE